ncbi:MAG: hypothetical protein J07HB67_01176 [halophilic archaeon J07HB67]|jgi:hypothetical protein|nr:MAG: hypothetical protein J07HB67_01176 [halophilic archaeon J07HB67]
MGEQLRLLVVGDDTTADVLGTDDDLVVTTARRETVTDRVCADHDVVALVGEPRLPDTGRSAVQTVGVPVVAYGPEPPTADWLSGFVRRVDGPQADSECRRLVDGLRRAVAGETRRQLQARRRRLATLHDSAAELAAVRSIEALYGRVLAVAADVVAFDTAVLSVREGDRLRTVAATPEGEWVPETRPIDDTLAGETLGATTPHLVDDARTDDRVTGLGEAVTVASVPIGADAVVQFGVREPNAFGAADLEVAQLLGTHVAETRERLVAEADARSRRERIAGLHRAATDLIDVDESTELYELTVDIAADVLQFDGCTLVEAVDDGFVVPADAGGDRSVGELLDGCDQSVMAHTHDTGESVVVDDHTDE